MCPRLYKIAGNLNTMYDQYLKILLVAALLSGASSCRRPEVTLKPRPIPVKSPVRPPSRHRDATTPDVAVIALAEAAALEFRVPNRRHVVVIDYDRSLFAERLFVVDMKKKAVILRSRVSHAMKSGKIFPSDFSNIPETGKSCVGAFRTGESYHGRFGYAMRIDGLEWGVNDNARRRAIVFHDYEAPVAYSKGCFITPPKVNRRLIDIIKGGTLVYVRKS